LANQYDQDEVIIYASNHIGILAPPYVFDGVGKATPPHYHSIYPRLASVFEHVSRHNYPIRSQDPRQKIQCKTKPNRIGFLFTYRLQAISTVGLSMMIIGNSSDSSSQSERTNGQTGVAESSPDGDVV